MDMGFQADPVASAASISIIAGLGAFLSKMSGLGSLREQRDTAAETLRKARVLLLAGKLDLESYERAAAVAEAAAQEYESAKTILSLGNTQVQIGDPTATPPKRRTTEAPGSSQASRSRNDVPQMTQAAINRLGDSRGVRPNEGSQSENRSLFGDLMFGFTIAQLLALFAFSTLPDPVMERREADPFCDPCAQLQAKLAPRLPEGVAQVITEEV
jgi:hypothetical protein